MSSGPIILFDGICNFCNSAINFVLKKDKTKSIKFAALQSEAGKEIVQQFGLPPNDMRSFLLIEDGKVYSRSAAALKVCRYLTGAWPLCYAFIIIPAFIRNAVYDLIARNRYRWFGKKDECMIPTPDMRARFL